MTIKSVFDYKVMNRLSEKCIELPVEYTLMWFICCVVQYTQDLSIYITMLHTAIHCLIAGDTLIYSRSTGVTISGYVLMGTLV